MTAPDQSSPDGSLGPGLFAQRQAMTEDDAKRQMRSSGLLPWTKAQDNMQAYMAGVGREVTRLENRIDQFVIGNRTVILHTFSTSGTWIKPKGATQVIVNAIGGSSGGGRSNDGGSGGSARGGLGGYSGAWQKTSILASELPSSVAVTVGAGSAGGTSDGATASAAAASSFGGLVIANGASGAEYGFGNHAFRVRGGKGGSFGAPSEQGGSGSFHPGGEAGKPDQSGAPGVNGHSITVVGQIGFGSGGGGGAQGAFSGNGGRGGDGGWPGGPGAGGGAYSTFGVAGNGGNGAGGAVWVMTYLEDTFGLAPAAPTGVVASAITSTTAHIKWTASTDDVAVARYEVLVDGNVAGESTTIDYDLTGLTKSTSYQVTVRAVDLGGNRSDPSSAITVTTTA